MKPHLHILNIIEPHANGTTKTRTKHKRGNYIKVPRNKCNQKTKKKIHLSLRFIFIHCKHTNEQKKRKKEETLWITGWWGEERGAHRIGVLRPPTLCGLRPRPRFIALKPQKKNGTRY